MLLKLSVNVNASKNCKIIGKGKHIEFAGGPSSPPLPPPFTVGQAALVFLGGGSPELVHPQELLK